MCSPEQRFFSRSIDRDYIQIWKGNSAQLKEGFTHSMVAVGGSLVLLHIDSDTFTRPHTGKVTMEAVQLILLSLLFSRMQPYLL